MHSLGPQIVMLASVWWAGINFLVVRWVVPLLHKNKLTYATLVFLWIVVAVEVSQSRLSLPVLLFIRCRIPNANWLRVTTILEVPNETILSLSPSDIGTMWKSEDKEREYPSSWLCVDFLGTLWAQRLTRFSRKELFYLVVLTQSSTGTEKP